MFPNLSLHSRDDSQQDDHRKGKRADKKIILVSYDEQRQTDVVIVDSDESKSLHIAKMQSSEGPLAQLSKTGLLTLTDSRHHHFNIGLSRFQFAHSVDPLPKYGAEFDRRQILIPTKVQDLIHRSIRTLSNSFSN